MECIWVSNYTAHKYSHFFNFIFICCSYIYKNVIRFRCFFFSLVSSVNCWPAKNSFYNAILSVHIYNLRRSNLVITTAIAYYIYKTVICYVIYIPRYLVCMSLYYYLKFCIWINYSHGCPIGVCKKFIYIRS